MAVDDHGLEVLKKSGAQVTPGDKSEYKIRVYGDLSTTPPTPSSTFSTGSNSAIGLTAGQLTTGSHVASVAVLLRADPDNTGIVYIGNSMSVTAGTADATDGMPLKASEPLTIEVDNTNKIYLISDTADQKVYWMLT